jgi:hypothetical protein
VVENWKSSWIQFALLTVKRLLSVQSKKAREGGIGMTVGIVAAAIVFWPAAPLFLLVHGKDITFPKGTDVPTFINGEMKLDPAKFQQAEGGSTQPNVTAATSNLTISSTPVGADIYVDQNFVGNTPSTVNAPSGKHSVTVRKTGFQDWVREMNLSGGTINLAAELVPGSTVPAAAPQGQAQSVQLQNADVTATSEVSVAEAARRNKAAKEAEKPKDNPPPQQ